MEAKFDDYKNMLWKLALARYNTMHNLRRDMEFDDVLSQAYLIYAWCIQNFKEGKGMKFSTYLYMQVRGRLADYYNHNLKPMTLYEDFSMEDDEDGFEVTLTKDYTSSNGRVLDLLDDAEKELSWEAMTTLRYLMSNKWRNLRSGKCPRNSQLTKALGYPPEVLDSVMGEIRGFLKRRKCFQVFEEAS